VKASKRVCCRSLPRCSRCPVLFGARPKLGTEADLIAEFLNARQPRPLPACVEEALAQIDLARVPRVADGQKPFLPSRRAS